MGKVQIITKIQEIILGAVSQSQYLTQSFYFTSGTALAAAYLQHRYSEDLDFFTDNEVNIDEIRSLLRDWSKKYHFRWKMVGKERVLFCFLTFSNGDKLKVDFGIYPHKPLAEKSVYKGIWTDSLLDIGANKMSTIGSRLEVKDFTDLYFILKKNTFWDLLTAVNTKFGFELDPYMIANVYALADRFTYMPRMIKKLTLDELKSFFRSEAEKLGRLSVY